MRRRKNKEEARPLRFFSEEEKIIDLLKRSADSEEAVSAGEALTLEQTVEVLQRLRSRQSPGSPVSIYLDARRGV